MKTMKLQNGSDPVRVKEQDVNTYLDRGYMYCPKSEYKDLFKKDERIVAKTKKTKKTKNKKDKKNVSSKYYNFL